jgi:hypothetical protein
MKMRLRPPEYATRTLRAAARSLRVEEIVADACSFFDDLLFLRKMANPNFESVYRKKG